MERTVSLWDPWRVFPPSEDDSRCIGQTKRAVDCRNQLSRACMRQATKTMVDLARMPPHSPDLQSHLLRLASLHLCRRWHQGQGNEVVHKWNAQLSRLFIPVREPRGVTPSPPTTASGTVTLASLHQREFRPTEQRAIRVEMAANATVVVSLYQPLPQFPDETCAICRGALDSDTDYLHCLSCQEGRYHWSCFQSWATATSHTPPNEEMSCQICHRGQRFAVFHQSQPQPDPTTGSQATTAIDETVTHAPETTPLAAEPTTRRSTRAHQAPNRYRP